MIRMLNKEEVREWLRDHGVTDVEAVMKGIDWGQAVYPNWLDVGTKLVQYRDRPSSSFPQGAIGGRCFALESHCGDIRTLGIGHGPAGRSRYVLTVRRPVQVLESTAKNMNSRAKMPYERDIGPGGATQVFIPDGGLSSLG